MVDLSDVELMIFIVSSPWSVNALTTDKDLNIIYTCRIGRTYWLNSKFR